MTQHEWISGQRVYSTGPRSHIIDGMADGWRTHCGRQVTEWWYPDLSQSLPLCRVCEKATE